jgi:hypothetical protein
VHRTRKAATVKNSLIRRRTPQRVHLCLPDSFKCRQATRNPQRPAPYEYISECWQKEPERCTVNPSITFWEKHCGNIERSGDSQHCFLFHRFWMPIDDEPVVLSYYRYPCHARRGHGYGDEALLTVLVDQLGTCKSPMGLLNGEDMHLVGSLQRRRRDLNLRWRSHALRRR